MKLLLDMNLPPAWCAALRQDGHDAHHWSTLGDSRATDRAIMELAHTNGFVVLTHDLDFGALLAATGARSPSVVLLRTGCVIGRGGVAGPSSVASLFRGAGRWGAGDRR